MKIFHMSDGSDLR